MSTSLQPRGGLDHELEAGSDDFDRARSTSMGRWAVRQRRRTAYWLVVHRTTLLWLLPLVIMSAVVFAIGMTGSPQRIDDEGTYTAQAYAVTHFGELGHYTYWYDHPPLGWLQLAGWTWLTDGFNRWHSAVFAGREFMLVVHLVSVVLLWVLGRRLGLRRVTVAAAVIIYSLSPLAVQFHRTVYLDNIATPWLLAAFVLALTKHRQLVAYGGVAICFAIAVLTKETFLLALPVLLWLMWRNSHPETRRYTFAVAGSLFVLLGGGYLLYALLKGELTPGAGHVSLWDGLQFQLSSRASSGGAFNPSSLTHANISMWVALDPVLSITAPVAALVALRSRALRPFAVLLLFLMVFMLRGGYLPVPYVVAMIPLAALLVPAAVETILRMRQTALSAGVLIVALLAAVIAVPLWGTKLRGLFLANLDQPLASAEMWIESNIPHDRRIIVDDSVWTDLVRAGFPRQNVVWFYKVDTDPSVVALSPNGWRDYDIALVTQSLRTTAGTGVFPQVDAALAHSTVLASFGSGQNAVQVVQVHPQGLAQAARDQRRDTAASAAAGSQLAQNPAITLPTAAKDLLTGGRVDGRVVALLALLGSLHTIVVKDFPADAGDAASTQRRGVILTSIDEMPTALSTLTMSQLQSQSGLYHPTSLQQDGGDLRIEFPAPTPEGLLPTASS
jgi:hypothetical protein